MYDGVALRHPSSYPLTRALVILVVVRVIRYLWAELPECCSFSASSVMTTSAAESARGKRHESPAFPCLLNRPLRSLRLLAKLRSFVAFFTALSTRYKKLQEQLLLNSSPTNFLGSCRIIIPSSASLPSPHTRTHARTYVCVILALRCAREKRG